MKSTIEAIVANFEAEVLKSSIPVIVDFWSTRCPPCRMVAPVLEEIAAELAGRLKVAKVNVDDGYELAARYGITSLPTLLYFANGQVCAQTVGATSKKAILAKVSELPAAAAA